jgi:glucosamine--fructose-6-phosphate aminotransferase (isomerizing)
LYTRAGVEIGATSTKAFSAQLVAVTLLALKLGLARGFADPSLVRNMLKALLELPDQLSVLLEQRDAIRRVAEQVADRSHFLFVGQGLGFPLALEGAAKLKETCPVEVDGNAVGEMKHGPLTRITRQTAVVAIAPRGGGRDTMAIDLDEIRARAGFTIAITTAGDDHIGAKADTAITIPPTLEWLQPVLVAAPLQLLAYHLGVLRGHERRQDGRTQWQPAPVARL